MSQRIVALTGRAVLCELFHHLQAAPEIAFGAGPVRVGQNDLDGAKRVSGILVLDQLRQPVSGCFTQRLDLFHLLRQERGPRLLQQRDDRGLLQLAMHRRDADLRRCRDLRQRPSSPRIAFNPSKIDCP